MRVLVLVHSSLIPPDSFSSKAEWESSKVKTEYDVVSTLKKMGHKVLCQGVSDDLVPIREALDNFKPRIVFNLLEEFAGEAIFDQNVVSYLQMQGVKYTGCSPRGLILARDKALSKKILSYHRILTPKFYSFPYGRSFRPPKKAEYPLFVKARNEEASLGITQKSIVKDEKQLKTQVAYFHQEFAADVIAESYIDGRELYVGLIGNARIQTLPIWELEFNKTSDRTPKIATNKVKWDMGYRKKFGIKTGAAKGFTEAEIAKIHKLCRRTYKALMLSGYARIDLRMTDKGEIYVIEANPNPDIGYQEELSDSAAAVEISYEKLLTKLIQLGLSRPNPR